MKADPLRYFGARTALTNAGTRSVQSLHRRILAVGSRLLDWTALNCWVLLIVCAKVRGDKSGPSTSAKPALSGGEDRREGARLGGTGSESRQTRKEGLKSFRICFSISVCVMGFDVVLFESTADVCEAISSN